MKKKITEIYKGLIGSLDNKKKPSPVVKKKQKVV